ARGRVGGEEHDAGGVATRRRQLGRHHRAEELVRDLDEDAGTVAGAGLGTDGAAVVQVVQHGEGVPDDVVAGGAGQRGDEADAARVVLLGRLVQTGSRGGSRR